MAAPSALQRCDALVGAHLGFRRDFSTVLALDLQRQQHAVIHEALRIPHGWSRQDGRLSTAGLLLLGVAVACPYPFPSTLQAPCPPWGPKHH